MKRKMLSMLMALAMILSLLPVTALAADVDSAEALQSALDAGGDVKLTESVTGNFVVPAGKAVTLDLNGNTITNDGDHTITVKYGASLTVTGAGTVDNVTHAKAAVWNEGTVFLNGGNYTRSKENGTSAEDAGGNSYYVLVNHGAMTVNSGVSVTQNGHFSSLLENGYYSYASGNASSGYVEGTNAQYPQLTINGGVFTGGLNTIKNDDGGMLTINDGTFSNTSQAAFLNWNVAAVNGGTFSSDGNCILNGGGDPAVDQGKLTINGGSFTSKKDAIAAMNNNAGYLDGVAVAGGTFSSDVSAYVDLSSNVTEDDNGNFVIAPNTKEDGVAEIGGKYYKTLGDAIASVGDGDTIQVLKDIPDAVGISVPSGKNFTIDFGGHTYTLTGPGAGSSNTETNGFQLLKDSAITMKNGTIRIAENASNINRMVQNYADLTLENMQFYAENQVGGENYALSFNNGNITFKGNTSVVTTSADAIAFDVCYWQSGGYTGTSVTFAPDYTGTVNGVIVYDSTDASKGVLSIQGNGTFGKIDVSSASTETPNIAIAGGTFTEDVKAYVVPGMEQDEDGKIVIDTDTAVAEINGVGYTSLDAALAAAKDGDTIKLLKDLESSAAITIPAGVTLDGDGKTLTYTGGSVEVPSNGAFLTAGGENVTIQNLTVETKNQIKHGVQFYSVKSGKLSGVTVNGGTYTSVIVNNSQNIILEDCVLNSNGYTNIEYAVGSNIADMVVPSLTVDNVTFKPAGENGKPFMIWADKDTVGRIVTVLGGQTTEADAVAKIKENVTNKNPGDVVISVGLENGTIDNETVDGEGYPSGSTSYAITVSKADNGTVTASRTRGTKGLTVTLTVKADEGYKLDTLTVTDKNGNEIKLTDKGDGKYTFTMPASAVTVKASFAKDDAPVETGLPFTDVKAGDWFYEAVKYAYDNKLMDGTSSTTFAPLMTTNRAMIVTILWRLEGSPVVNYAMNFSDVESGVWYTEAVRWAAAEGIVKGYSDTVFAPDDTVTREQLATILYRYAEYKEYDVSAKGDLTTFADGSTVSTWAADGMTWAVGAQLITGKDGGKLDPTGTATRAEVATILMRFCENVAK